MEWIIPIVVSLVITLSYLGISKGWVLNKHDVKRIGKVARARKNAAVEVDDFSLEKWVVERRRMRQQEKREWDMEYADLLGHNRFSKTVDLAAIQRHLRHEGLYSGPCDGAWGDASRRALQMFERQMQPPGTDRAVRPLANGGEYRHYADGRSEITLPGGRILVLGRNADPYNDEVRYPYSRRGAPVEEEDAA